MSSKCLLIQVLIRAQSIWQKVCLKVTYTRKPLYVQYSVIHYMTRPIIVYWNPTYDPVFGIPCRVSLYVNLIKIGARRFLKLFPQWVCPCLLDLLQLLSSVCPRHRAPLFLSHVDPHRLRFGVYTGKQCIDNCLERVNPTRFPRQLGHLHQ